MKKVKLLVAVGTIPAGTEGHFLRGPVGSGGGDLVAVLRVCGLDLEVSGSDFEYVRDDKSGSGDGDGDGASAGESGDASGGGVASNGENGLPVACEKCGAVRGAGGGTSPAT